MDASDPEPPALGGQRAGLGELPDGLDGVCARVDPGQHAGERTGHEERVSRRHQLVWTTADSNDVAQPVAARID